MSQPQPAFRDGTPIGGMGRGSKFLPNTTDWLGRFRLAANPSNGWRIDRMTQQDGRHEHFGLHPLGFSVARALRRMLASARQSLLGRHLGGAEAALGPANVDLAGSGG
jgi:hypothetical protein